MIRRKEPRNEHFNVPSGYYDLFTADDQRCFGSCGFNGDSAPAGRHQVLGCRRIAPEKAHAARNTSRGVVPGKPHSVRNTLQGNGHVKKPGKMACKKPLTAQRFKGVSFNKKTHKWGAYIWVKGKQVYLGMHNSAEEAAEVYRVAARCLEEYGCVHKSSDAASSAPMDTSARVSPSMTTVDLNGPKARPNSPSRPLKAANRAAYGHDLTWNSSGQRSTPRSETMPYSGNSSDRSTAWPKDVQAVGVEHVEWSVHSTSETVQWQESAGSAQDMGLSSFLSEDGRSMLQRHTCAPQLYRQPSRDPHSRHGAFSIVPKWLGEVSDTGKAAPSTFIQARDTGSWTPFSEQRSSDDSEDQGVINRESSLPLRLGQGCGGWLRAAQLLADATSPDRGNVESDHSPQDTTTDASCPSPDWQRMHISTPPPLSASPEPRRCTASLVQAGRRPASLTDMQAAACLLQLSRTATAPVPPPPQLPLPLAVAHEQDQARYSPARPGQVHLTRTLFRPFDRVPLTGWARTELDSLPPSWRQTLASLGALGPDQEVHDGSQNLTKVAKPGRLTSCHASELQSTWGRGVVARGFAGRRVEVRRGGDDSVW